VTGCAWFIIGAVVASVCWMVWVFWLYGRLDRAGGRWQPQARTGRPPRYGDDL